LRRNEHEKFLDLRKDADPGIAEMEDAKQKLAWLKGTELESYSWKRF
jgi:hypothetical protein